MGQAIVSVIIIMKKQAKHAPSVEILTTVEDTEV